MHEQIYVRKIVEAGKRFGVKNEVEIEVGELCDISAEELKEAVGAVTSWKISATEKKSKIKCGCGYLGNANILDKGHGYCYFNCPKCGASEKNIKVVEGGEIKIVGVG